MLTIRELIKTLYNALIQRMKKYRGNWEQNDPTADDYIKNRPFYTDDSKKVVIVPNQQITFSDYGARLALSEVIEFVVGQSYEVKWDDVNYTCVAWDFNGIGAIGNQRLMDRPIDTGEPFIIMISKAEGMGAIQSLTTTGTHTVEVTASAKIVKIDQKYLPNFARVARSGSYDDLTDKPPFAIVAMSGNYNDLTNKPTIYTDAVRYNVSQSLNTAQKIQARANIGAGTSSFSGSYNDLTNKPTLATVATSGSYNDLSNKPFEEQHISTVLSNVSWNSLTQIYSNIDKSILVTYVDSGQPIDDSQVSVDSIFEGAIYSLTVSDGSNTITVSGIMQKREVDDNANGANICFVLGNPYLYSYSIGSLNDFFTIENSADTGEYFLLAMQPNKNYSGWSRIVLTCKRESPYMFNKACTVVLSREDTNIIQLDEKFIPNTIARTSQIPAVDPTLSIEGNAADAKAVGDAVTRLTEQKADKSELEKLNIPKKAIFFIDQINGYKYVACMRDGNFITYCAIKNIEVTSMPSKNEYIAGDYFDPTGMVVSAIAYDGTTKEIVDYTLPESYLTNGTTSVEISYIDAGLIYTVNVPVTVNEFDPSVVLVDFEYIANDDGTYTLTGWKGTHNGEASTEMIIPNNGLIIV